MNKESLLKFIAKAHRNTYAAPKEIKMKHKCETPILPEHTDYDFVEGNFRYHDSYAGWSWPPGKEVVFFEGKPVWCMSYQGKINDDLGKKFTEKVYRFLKKALMNFDENTPFRGPSNFQEDDFEYSFSFEGDYSYFVGKEVVKHKGEEVFFQDVMGSLIK
tara:strand:- start:112 stop:591 length:480 start_codon:yes stop_codon:yes gene_type:complete